jgi:hypothetical protein
MPIKLKAKITPKLKVSFRLGAGFSAKELAREVTRVSVSLLTRGLLLSTSAIIGLIEELR